MLDCELVRGEEVADIQEVRGSKPREGDNML